MEIISSHQCNLTSYDNRNISNTDGLFVSECVGITGCIPLEECRHLILDHVRPTSVEWLVIVVYIVVFCVGLLGNGLVCFVVSRTSHMQTITNIFIVNLAVADFLVILICLPPSVLTDTTESWYLGDVMCKVVSCLQTVSVAVSVLTLSAIAVERYFAICHPLRRRLNRHTVSIIIAFIWMSSIMIALPELLHQQLHKSYPDDVTIFLQYCKSSLADDTMKYYQIFLMVGLYDFPMCIMLLAYVTISFRLWRDNFFSPRQNTEQRNQFTANRPENQLSARRKAARMLMTIVILFAVCYMPIHVFNILMYNGNLGTMDPMFIIIYALTSRGLCYLNSAINPIIYNFMSAKFRQEFKAAFSRCRRDQIKVPVKMYNFRATRSSGHTGTGTERLEHYTLQSVSCRTIHHPVCISQNE